MFHSVDQLVENLRRMGPDAIIRLQNKARDMLLEIGSGGETSKVADIV